ncbi:MAG: STAS domain-containing protein [Ignavibacteriaceae bacterium]
MREFESSYTNEILVIDVDLFRASAAEAVRFKNILDREIADGYNNLVIDLTKCLSIDSTFIGALIVTKKKLELSDGQLKLIITDKIIQNAAHLVKTISIFNTFYSIHDALRNNNLSNVEVEVKTERMFALV